MKSKIRKIGSVIICLTMLASIFTIVVATAMGASNPISFYYEGEVIRVEDIYNLLGGTITEGDAVSGMFTYDLDTPDTNDLDTVGDYWHYSAPYGISTTINGLTFKTDANDVDFLVEVGNNWYGGRDFFLLRSYNNVFAVPMDEQHISWQLDDTSGTALDNTDLPTSINLDSWEQNFGLRIWGENFSPLPSESYFIKAIVNTVEPLTVSIATIDFDPDTLNLQSKGKWVTSYIELPEGYDVNNIDVSTVMLNDQVQAEARPTKIGDYDNDDIADLMVKFDRSAVQEILEVGEEVEITITGELTDGTPFEGSDTIRVVDKGKGK